MVQFCQAMIKGQSVIGFNTMIETSKYGLLERTDKLENEVMWFELPSHMSFHTVNTWDEDNKVVMISCIAKTAALDKASAPVPPGRKYVKFYEDQDTCPHLYKLTFDLVSSP